MKFRILSPLRYVVHIGKSSPNPKQFDFFFRVFEPPLGKLQKLLLVWYKLIFFCNWNVIITSWTTKFEKRRTKIHHVAQTLGQKKIQLGANQCSKIIILWFLAKDTLLTYTYSIFVFIQWNTNYKTVFKIKIDLKFTIWQGKTWSVVDRK